MGDKLKQKQDPYYIEGQFQSMVETLEQPIVIFDYNGRYDYLNDAAKKLYEPTFGKLTGKTLHEINPAEIADKYVDVIRKTIDGNEPWETVLLDESTGENNWFVSRMYRMPEIGNGMPRAMGVLFNITKQKEAELAYNKSEKYLKLLLDNTDDLIIIADKKGSPLLFNNSIAHIIKEVMGIDLYTGDNILKRTLEEYDPVFLKDLEKVFEGQHIISDYSFSINGNDHSVEVSLNPTVENGEVTGFCAIARDITKTKRIQISLRESEKKYRLLFDHSPVSITYVTKDGKYILQNSLATRNHGYSKDEIIGKSFFDIHPHHLAEKFQNNVRQVVKTGEGLVVEDWVDFPSGKKFHSSNLQPVTENGVIQGVQVISIDHTKQKLYEEELLKSREELEDNVRLRTEELTAANTDLEQEIRVRKKAESELEKSKELLTLFMDSATDLFAVYDKDLILLEANQAIVDLYLLGDDKADLIGKSIKDLVPGIEKTDRYKMYKKVLNTGIPYSEENIISSPLFAEGIFSIKAFRVGDGLGLIYSDITKQKQVENTLLKVDKELTDKNIQLNKKNVALNELLQQVEVQKSKIGEQVKSNVNNLIKPLISSLMEKLSPNNQSVLSLIEHNLEAIASSFGSNLPEKLSVLSRREIEICNMIKQGHTSRAIADEFHISIETVTTHRNNIRKKLGLRNSSVNLPAYLNSL